MRLLPDDPELGWTPYAYLIYLASFVLLPLGDPRTTAWHWLAYGVALVIFLALYFRGYWEHGGRLLAIVGAICLIGALLMPINIGAGTLFIYAGAFAGRLGPQRSAIRWVGAITALVLVEAWLLSLHPYYFIPAAVFTPLVGGLTIHDAERRRADTRLRLAQDEVQRLATVAERERIARDLHDLLGHTLSVIVLKSELASRLATRAPERAVQEIRDVERISREALAEVRRAVQGYRSSGVRDEAARARETLDSAGVALTAEITSVPLPPVEDHALALVLREAVTNVVRHARATRCEVRLEADDGRVRLTVTDDGVGAHGEQGSGLTGMRDRVRELGGELELDTSRGTAVKVSVPLRRLPVDGVAVS